MFSIRYGPLFWRSTLTDGTFSDTIGETSQTAKEGYLLKKFMLAATMSLLLIAMMGCDFLSTIIAVKDFYAEYTTYSDIYMNTDHLALSMQTDLQVIESDIVGLEAVELDLEMVVDNTTNLTYVQQTRNQVARTSVLENVDGLMIEYLIVENLVIPSVITEGENDTLAQTMYDIDVTFSIESVNNELKTGTHSYEMDLYLDQVFSLTSIADFISQLDLFASDLSVFNNALAHVALSFETVESTIDINIELTDYRLDFLDGTYAIVTLTTHATLSIPTAVEIIDVFSSPYVMKAVDDIRLAQKVYHANELIALPFLANQNGWIQLDLAAGIYQIQSAQYGLISQSYFVNAAQTVIPFDAVGSIQVTITTAGSYFFKIVPSVNLTTDLRFVPKP